MIRDITLGNYIPGDSIIHKIDSRVKIILVLLLIILTFICTNFFGLLILVIAILSIMFMSAIPIKMYLKSLKMILIIVLITSGLNLFYGKGEPIFKLWFVTITEQGIYSSIFIAIRIISLILISSILTFTTSPTDLTDGLERLMSPLTKLHINVYDIAMMMTIALRFVPTLLEETDKIMNAQKARGADLESGNITQRIRALIPILIPLFVSSFRRAYDLAMAMECRCYRGGEGRTKMNILTVKKLDFFAIGYTVVCLGLIVVSNILMPSVLV